MTALGINLAIAGDETVLRLTGELDMAAAPDLIAMADTAMGRPDLSALVFDMAGVTFLDSAGVGAMVTIDRECRALGVSFRGTGTTQRVRRTLELVGLQNWFETD